MSHPTKDTAEEVAKRHGKDAVIVFYVDAQEGQWGYASYGKDRQLGGWLMRCTKQEQST
jgi:hypothetical protein